MLRAGRVSKVSHDSHGNEPGKPLPSLPIGPDGSLTGVQAHIDLVAFAYSLDGALGRKIVSEAVREWESPL